MFSKLRKRFTYTNAALTVALVFVMTGGAYAASKYIITSTKQIKPSVLSALKGNAGKTGSAGPAGPAGPAGAKGETGSAGSAGTAGTAGTDGTDGTNGTNGTNGAQGPTGPAGATGKGTTGPTGPAGTTGPQGETGPTGPSGPITGDLVASISFPTPITALGGSEVHYIGPGETTTECPGSATTPEATSGNLCVYQAAAAIGVELVEGSTTTADAGIFPPGASLTEVLGHGVKGSGTSGAEILFSVVTDADHFSWGAWALTPSGGTTQTGAWSTSA